MNYKKLKGKNKKKHIGVQHDIGVQDASEDKSVSCNFEVRELNEYK